MQKALRLAVCLVTASASTPVFADSATDDASVQQQGSDHGSYGAEEADASRDSGSGGREPITSPTAAHPGTEGLQVEQIPVVDDGRERGTHQQFVENVWALP